VADPGPEVRLELCRLAVAGDDRLGVSDVEVRRGGPSYTADTLRELHAQDTGGELTFIVGGDMALSLPSWHEPAEVLRLARLAVAERLGVTRREIEERLAGLGAADRIAFFAMPRLDLSSTDLRRRVAEGLPIRYLVPDAVADAIAARGLYT
jgi:nicotinate-nucleotide adenylyltransferase